MAKKIAVSKILICDDSEQTRIMLRSVFSNEGFVVLEAKDGEMAQEMAEKHKPDLIIMDIVMPKQDGITTIKNLKAGADTHDIPIIVITGKSAITELLEDERENIEAVFEKPFPLRVLREKVSKIFNE
ncbi:MAG: response regulator [Elusimicrobia bacterium]|nr:response regulator [Elusimicrobiota bacterium]